MGQGNPGVDREELDGFLASAPESLRAWAEEQREALSAEPTLAELEDADIMPDDEVPASKAGKVNSTAKGINKVLVGLLAAAIVLLVQQWGRPAPTEEAVAPHGDMGAMTAAPAATFAPLDEDRVAELEEQLADDETNLDALRELARLHDASGLWQEANDYQQRILAIDPDDFDALLADGVFKFNSGDIPGAETQWTRATELRPDDPEGYYNLGFVHMAKEPADVEAARAAWEQLIEVAPDSQLAKTAESHIHKMVEGAN